MFEYIFATVEQDEFDVIALGLECGRCSIVYHGKHGQVVMGFVDNTQMHIKPTSLEGSQLRDCSMAVTLLYLLYVLCTEQAALHYTLLILALSLARQGDHTEAAYSTWVHK